MNEMDFIAYLKGKLVKPPSLVNWLDDDCEILNTATGLLLLSVDTSSEISDFPSDSPNHCMGYFSTSLSLSDIAACGGFPLGVLVSCCVPKSYDTRLKEIYDGIQDAVSDGCTYILGGDTNSAAEFSLSVVSIGHVEQVNVMRRKMAKVGDLIGVTGELSRFNTGFFEYKKEKTTDFYRMLHQKPPIDKGRILSSSCFVTSCIDLPDGLVKALNDNTDGSYGYLIRDSFIPVDNSFYKSSLHGMKYKYECASYPAGDIELLFTVPENKRDIIEKEFYKNRECVYWIGNVTENPGIHVETDNNGIIQPSAPGFIHEFKGKRLFE